MGEAKNGHKGLCYRTDMGVVSHAEGALWGWGQGKNGHKGLCYRTDMVAVSHAVGALWRDGERGRTATRAYATGRIWWKSRM